MKMVIFKLDKEKYAINMDQVIFVDQIEGISSLRNKDTYIEGVIEIRDRITTVINMYVVFSKKKTSVQLDKPKVIVINRNGQSIGLMVEEITEVLDIPNEVIQPLGFKSNNDLSYFTGIAKINHELIIVLDLYQLMSSINIDFEIEKIDKSISHMGED